MSNVFLISDTHFFHERVIGFSKRPFSNVDEMNEAMVDNWNKVIGKRDTVWHLGDLCFGPPRNLQIVQRLHGQKNLILGNHDQYGIRAYTDLFNKIEAAKKYDGYLLTHIPIHPDEFYRWEGNVHGHLHVKEVLKSPHHPDKRYFNVSVEKIGYTPIAWEEIKKRMSK